MQVTRSIKAKKLQPGMTLAFDRQHLNLVVDAVEDTRDTEVLVRCGYSKGDDSTTMFFGQEEKVLILA
jgi:hypothetical protein